MRLPVLTCKRCGHGWHPRSEKKPRVCPNKSCKSPYWDKDRKTSHKKHPRSREK